MKNKRDNNKKKKDDNKDQNATNISVITFLKGGLIIIILRVCIYKFYFT